ncbi:Nif3-like dinuclear metal center hexameric protein [Fusobacterium sp. PH5-44]|uniref:Nif3-like dinuclear metal center hexameric protein n=1 Tax=unclassified Fusobacterium TaxID=2648384 RepID=UPI003D232B8B
MKIKDIINILETHYPISNGEHWDNNGLLIGNYESNVDKVQLSLDITESVIEHAIKNGIKLIITHHPMIFSPIKQINSRNILGRKIIKLIENKIAVYTMHTNLDSSPCGLNEYILELLSIKKFEILDEKVENSNIGIGRYFLLNKRISIKEYADYLKERLSIPSVRIISSSLDNKIGRVGIVNGSGMEYWKKALHLGIDLFVTGDVKYHDALDAVERKMNIIDIGHYSSEKLFGDILIKYLKEMKIDVRVYNEKDLFYNY